MFSKWGLLGNSDQRIPNTSLLKNVFEVAILSEIMFFNSSQALRKRWREASPSDQIASDSSLSINNVFALTDLAVLELSRVLPLFISWSLEASMFIV